MVGASRGGGPSKTTPTVRLGTGVPKGCQVLGVQAFRIGWSLSALHTGTCDGLLSHPLNTKSLYLLHAMCGQYQEIMAQNRGSTSRRCSIAVIRLKTSVPRAQDQSTGASGNEETARPCTIFVRGSGPSWLIIVRQKGLFRGTANSSCAAWVCQVFCRQSGGASITIGHKWKSPKSGR